MSYGNKRDYPKIDMSVRGDNGEWRYAASTTWAKTCKEAKERFAAVRGIQVKDVRAHFDRRAT